jgi:Arc/MetJ-type ribon-helix-helix transcriptional regulator
MEMMRLAHRLKVQSGRHYSLADVVRAGMTALAIQQDRKERRDGVPTDRQEDR